MTRLAVLFHRLGPYHVARLRAANSCGRGELVAIELSGSGGEYDWDAVAGSGFERVAVRPEGDSNDLPRGELAALVESTLYAARPDAIAIAGWSDRGMLLAAGWGRKKGMPMVVMSDSQYHDESRLWWRELVKRRIIGAFGAGFAAGTPHADYLARLGLPQNRITTGYDVVDNAYFDSGADAAKLDSGARARLGLPRDYFLCCARFVSKKNIAGLLAAFADYRRGGNWDLVLVGDGPLRPELERQAESLGLVGRVHWAGFRQYAELPAYYGLASALVLPSVQEQWGLVINEAMAAGLPVITTDVCGAVPDLVVDGETGFVVPADDAQKLAQRMADLSADPARARAMGAAGRLRIAAWDLNRFATGLWDAVELCRPRPRSVLTDACLKRMAAR